MGWVGVDKWGCSAGSKLTISDLYSSLSRSSGVCWVLHTPPHVCILITRLIDRERIQLLLCFLTILLLLGRVKGFNLVIAFEDFEVLSS